MSVGGDFWACIAVMPIVPLLVLAGVLGLWRLAAGRVVRTGLVLAALRCSTGSTAT